MQGSTANSCIIVCHAVRVCGVCIRTADARTAHLIEIIKGHD